MDLQPDAKSEVKAEQDSATVERLLAGWLAALIAEQEGESA